MVNIEQQTLPRSRGNPKSCPSRRYPPTPVPLMTVVFLLCILSIIIIFELVKDGFQLEVVAPNAFSPSEFAKSAPNRQQQCKKGRKNQYKYIPAQLEKYIMEHTRDLGYASTDDPSGCNVWKSQSTLVKSFLTFQIDPQQQNEFEQYRLNLQRYTDAMSAFEPIPDLLESIQSTGTHTVCRKARLHPDGLQEFFQQGQLSNTKSGFVEPLTPPMRNPNICFEKERSMDTLLELNYLVHDFEAMCRNLKPTSKRILLDLGASLEFHSDQNPMLTLLETYEKFGFQFDHIYAFEKNFTDPTHVFQDLIPDKYLTKYHWINAGVEYESGNALNPWESILKRFSKDDFIVVKLDIDTSFIEVPLARQLLEDLDCVYHELIDQFYFEHHVHMKELAPCWLESMEGTIEDTMNLFVGLRERGIPAHFWP